jgi:predicted TIM-barrel fold metal-dependent hydrolase
MVIDFKLRPPLDAFGKLTVFGSRLAAKKRPASWVGAIPESVQQKSLPLFMQEMADAGVRHGVVWGRAERDPAASTTLEDVARFVGAHRGAFSGLGGIRIPEDASDIARAVADVETALVRLELKGITIEPGFAMSETNGPDDPHLHPVYERCQELGAIVAFTISVRAGRDMRYSDPALIDRVAERFPRLKMVIGHSFWPWVAQACGMAYRRKNVYLMPDIYGIACVGHRQWVEAANTLLDDQILFGSCYPLAGIGPMVDGYRKLGFRDDVLERVMWRNAAELLELTP